ncbi:serine hydrolase domain-containing protein [Agromyces bauzanensis]
MPVPKRRLTLAAAAMTASAALLAGCTAGEDAATTAPATSATTDAAIQSLLDQAAAEQVDARALGSLVAEIRVDGEVVASTALGEAMAGEPVTLDGTFRNGAVAITYVSTVMLRLAEEGVIDLDEPIARWLPDFPDADAITPRMLADMTAGVNDHVANAEFIDAVVADPFRSWTNAELLELSRSTPRLFEPGENWDYSHSGYVLLAEVMEAASGSSLEKLIDEYVLGPLDLEHTVPDQTAAMPEPAIHAFTAERGVWEDSTFWNPSWTLPEGAVQTSTIDDMAAGFDAIVGRGELLADDSYAALIDPALVGFGAPLEGCRSCHELTEDWSYGLGAVLAGDWVLQTPLFGGYASTVATLPAERADDGRAVTIAVAVTYTRDSFEDWDGALPNWANELARELGAELVPGDPPPAFQAPTH